MDSVEIFVPGRLCLFGEHSDWASLYSKENKNIKNGLAIVVCLDKGIKAVVEKNKNTFFLCESENNFILPMEERELLKHIRKNDYYSYVCSTAYYMLKKYNVKGIKIIIEKNTLPQKKGISSSAAICTLVCRAFNKVYDLGLSKEEEMLVAYESERNIGIKCGKMDQIVAAGSGALYMKFKDDNVSFSKLNIKNDLYFVYADLKSGKNTEKILSSLNSAFPFPKNKVEEEVVNYFCDINHKILGKAKRYIEDGDSKKIGELMVLAQEKFDTFVAPICKEELSSPVLHKVLSDSKVKELSLGGKGVGSQGDGSVQFIVENEEKQKELKDYLNNELKLDAYSFTVKKSSSIKTAVIPVAGSGTRMAPFTKAVPKSFIPIVKNNEFKPVIQVLVEELTEAGIEKVILVIDKKDKLTYKKLFDNRFSEKIVYVEQLEKKGLGGAVLCAKEKIKDDRFLLVLGDQFFKSNTIVSCTEQFLEAYNKLHTIMFSVCKIDKKFVSNYGIFLGEKKKKNYYKIDKILEKPSIEEAQKYSKDDNYYAAFGEYIIDNRIIKRIEEYKKTSDNGKEFLFTEFLDELYSKESFAFIPNGRMFDVGNINAYRKAMVEYYEKK